MRLKSLEIKGFKSFADRTLIHFNDNLTGIVGPNGCGKSNTVDAIRWVLGEQKSKALRLEKMDNIIFNGSKKRKSSGRAEVALTFENTKNLLPTEFTTVTVSRIIYRTGESEYRLNNVKCRLKDIKNLFMDTGISSDSYAIIELKMIEEILSDKENSRRKLFEQAAGISKYKVRKKQTHNKLSATQQDLERVEDLLFEIEKNLKTLERQAKRTKRYYELKDEYKRLSIELALHDLSEHKAAYARLEAQQQAEEDKRMGVDTALSQFEADLEARKKEVLMRETRLAEIQKDLNTHVAALSAEENKRNLLNQNLKFLREKRQGLTEQIQRARRTLANLSTEIDEARFQTDEEKAKLNQIKSTLVDLEASAKEARAKYDEGIKDLNYRRRIFSDAERQVFNLEKQSAVKKSQKETFEREVSDNRMKFQSRQSELDELSANLSKVAAEHTAAQARFDKQLLEEETLQNKLADSEKELEEARIKQADINRELDALRNEHKLTKSLVDSLEGFPDSIVYLKKNEQAWNNSKAPLLLDLINCEEAYKVTIENYLKPHLNNYVVKDVQEAIAAVQLLDEKNKGKADFLILSDLKDNAKSATNETFDDAIPAIDVVKTKAAYKPLVNALLDGVYILKEGNLPSDASLKKGGIFLSPDGKISRSPSKLSGGSVGAYEGKRIGQRQHLEKLSEQIEGLEQQVVEINQGFKRSRDAMNQLKNDIHGKKKLIEPERGE